MKQRLMVVDDDGFSAVHLEGLLSDLFEVAYFQSGPEALAAAAAQPPDIVLMDVEMPDMNGYEACRRLKEMEETAEVPVIFLSAHGADADRSAGYEAGGDDYLAKPFNPEELRRKIAVILRHQTRNRALAAHAQAAARAAMAAMTSAGDVGTVLNFLRQIVTSTDLDMVAVAALETLKRYELDAAIQVRHAGKSCSWNNQGVCPPLEESVLATMASCARIVDLGSRSAFNYQQVSVIVNNMPKEDAERYGRMKDVVIMVAEAVDIHLKALDLVTAAEVRSDTLLELVRSSAIRLTDVATRQAAPRAQAQDILRQLTHDIEDSFLTLVLTERQEEHFHALITEARRNAEALAAETGNTEAALGALTGRLTAALNQDRRNAGGSVMDVPRAELF